MQTTQHTTVTTHNDDMSRAAQKDIIKLAERLRYYLDGKQSGHLCLVNRGIMVDAIKGQIVRRVKRSHRYPVRRVSRQAVAA